MSVNAGSQKDLLMQKGQPLPDRWEDFLLAFSGKTANATADIPSTRCISKKKLSTIITAIKDELGLLTTFPSGVEVLSHLCAMGLASRVPVTNNGQDAPSREFYLVGMSDSHNQVASPFELLQAYDDDGVICFFSALSYYDLTTQFPTHHHVASITVPSTTDIDAKRDKRPSPQTTNIKKKKSIGTLIFSYDGADYYTTKRQKNTIPGTKSRYFNQRTILNITTVEQTMLDTLQYPVHCGGPEVVFEAWENHVDKIDEDILLDHLQRISTDTLNRRLGALYALLDYAPTATLRTYLENARNTAKAISDPYDITLLRGINYFNLNTDWNVLVP